MIRGLVKRVELHEKKSKLFSYFPKEEKKRNRFSDIFFDGKSRVMFQQTARQENLAKVDLGQQYNQG